MSSTSRMNFREERGEAPYVRSTTVAVGALAATDLMPFSIPEVEVYISLLPMVSPFLAPHHPAARHPWRHGKN